MKRNNNTTKTRKPRKARAPKSIMNLGPSYQGQQRVVLTLPGTNALLSTAVTTGLINSSTPIQNTEIGAFATRFGQTFDEYRILGVNVKVRPTAASTGISVMFFDEKDSAVPTLNEANGRIGKRLPNTNAQEKSMTVLKWRAKDLLDLEYTAIGTTTPVAWFKVYTAAGAFGAPAVVTALWHIEIDYIVEFRGVNTN